MKVHLSIDDVVIALKSLYENQPASVFDESFFGYLKHCHMMYDAKFSLYCFVTYKDFVITKVPHKYWEELKKASDWIRFGFHGVREHEEDFYKSCEMFYDTIPFELQTQTIRLHRYQVKETELKVLKDFGVKELLCRDDESRVRLQAPPSYNLSEVEFETLSLRELEKNNVKYGKTNIQIELYDEKSLVICMKNNIYNLEQCSKLVVFTHEIKLPEKENLMKAVMELISEMQVEYVL